MSPLRRTLVVGQVRPPKIRYKSEFYSRNWARKRPGALGDVL